MTGTVYSRRERHAHKQGISSNPTNSEFTAAMKMWYDGFHWNRH